MHYLSVFRFVLGRPEGENVIELLEPINVHKIVECNTIPLWEDMIEVNMSK